MYYVKNLFNKLGKVQWGRTCREWVELPATDEELEKVKERIGINQFYEEWFITDYETNFGFKIDEYANLDELNEMAETLDNLSDTEIEIIEALTNNGYDLQDALEVLDDVIYYSDCNDMEDIAYQYIEESGLLNNVPRDIARYFDYAAFGRDMEIEGNFMFTNYGNCIQVLWNWKKVEKEYLQHLLQCMLSYVTDG